MILIKRTQKDIEALHQVSINPSDLEDDGVDYQGVRIKKPWGHEIEKYRDENVSVTWMHIHSQQQTSLHCHLRKTTFLFVSGGDGTLVTLSGNHPISEGLAVIIEKRAFHRLVADGPIILWEVETPPNKKDLVRLSDAYGRGQGYVCENTTPSKVTHNLPTA